MKIYDVCDRCGKIVRANKPILGDLHICSTEEEWMDIKTRIAIQVRRDQNKALLQQYLNR